MSKATTVIGLIAVVAVAAISARTYASSHSADTSAAADSTATAANVVQVVGEDFRFEAPDVIQAGLTEFKFLNKGPALHHMSLVKLNEGKTVDDLRAALANPGPPPPARFCARAESIGPPPQTTSRVVARRRRRP